MSINPCGAELTDVNHTIGLVPVITACTVWATQHGTEAPFQWAGDEQILCDRITLRIPGYHYHLKSFFKEWVVSWHSQGDDLSGSQSWKNCTVVDSSALTTLKEHSSTH